METMNDRFRKWFCGDEAACHFAEQLWTALQEWDDIEDEGRCLDVNGLLSWLSFGKEYQPFFAAHSHVLRPAFLSLYLKWTAANVLDRGSKSDVEKSYMLRAEYYGLLHIMAWICGGDAWAREVGPEIYRSYGETVDDLLKEFGTCQHQQ